MRSFICENFTQTDSESFSNSVMGMCEISLWMSNITPPPLEFLSFLYTLYGHVSGNNSEVDMYGVPFYFLFPIYGYPKFIFGYP